MLMMAPDPVETCVTQLEDVATAFLEDLAPEHLARPGELDLVDLLEHRLPPYGVRMAPVDPAFEADSGVPMATDALADTVRMGECIYVRLPERSTHRALTRWASRAERQGARQIVAHELGHLWHHGFGAGLHRIGWQPTPARWSRQECDPEWQADVLGGCLLVPRRTLMMIPAGAPLESVAHVYDVSAQWMGEHLFRLGLHRRHPTRDEASGPAKWTTARQLLRQLEALADNDLPTTRP